MAMSGSTAILLFDYMAKKKRVSFSPVFQPLLGPLEAAAETILLERLDVSQAGFEEAPLSARRVDNKPSHAVTRDRRPDLAENGFGWGSSLNGTQDLATGRRPPVVALPRF